MSKRRGNICTFLRSPCMEALEFRRLLSAPPLSPSRLLPGDTGIASSAAWQDRPDVAGGLDGASNAVYLAVWEDARPSLIDSNAVGGLSSRPGLGFEVDIFASRLDEHGNVIDTTPIAISTVGRFQTTPVVGWNGSAWLVAWRAERPAQKSWYDINAVRVSPQGQLLDASPITLYTATTSSEYAPPLDITSDGNNWLLLRVGLSGGNWAPVAHRVAPDGTPLDGQGVALRTFSGNGFGDASIAYSSAADQYLLTFTYWDDLYAQPFSTNLTAGAQMQLNLPGTESRLPSVGGGPEGWLVAWHDEPIGFNVELYAARITPAGANLGTFLLDDGEPYGDYDPDVVWTGTDWAVAYNVEPFGQSYDIHLRRVAADGTIGPEQVLSSATGFIGERRPAVASAGNGDAQVVYEHLEFGPWLASPYDVNGVHVDSANNASAPQPVAVGARRQTRPDLADNGNGFLAVFRSDSGTVDRVVAQRLDAQGVAIDAEPVVLFQGTLGNRYDFTQEPKVAFNGNVYLVVWSDEFQTLQGIRVGLNGQPIDPAPFTIANQAIEPDVSALGGTFLVSYIFVDSPQRQSVYAARVGADGTVLETPFAVNLAGFNEAPVVATLGGRWLVAWEQNSTHNNEGSHIGAAFVSATGSVGSPFSPSSGAAGYGDYPDIAVNGNQALVVWSSGGLHPEVRGRLIDSNGALLSGPLDIAVAPEFQEDPRVAFNGTQYVVTWSDTRNYPYPLQMQSDVFAARVSTDGTVLDPGGFPVADGQTPQVTPTVAASAGNTVFVYSAYESQAPYAALRLSTREMTAADLLPPTVINGSFAYTTAQWAALEFSENISASLELSDLVVTNLTSGQPALPLSLTYDPATYTAKFMFDAPLPDGNYRAMLPAGSVQDPSGNVLDEDFDIDFFFLNGDANRDGRVNLDDFNFLAANFGQSPRDFTQGDFNYDGQVNLADFNILAGRFGNVLGSTPIVAGDGVFAAPRATESIASLTFKAEDGDSDVTAPV